MFLFDTSIKDNFRQFYEFRELPKPNDAQIIKMLNVCCIDFTLDKDCTSMSGGERQRIYTAIFLSFKPKVIMLDEPTSALDEKTSILVIENILGYCKQNDIEIIIVTHDRSVKEGFEGKVIELERSVL